jgi:MFS family permease
VAWALLSETIPLYPLYALLFADAGLSGGEISSLFVVWSVAGIVAEVPSGALADRFSRRVVLAVHGVMQAAAYVLWLTVPGFAGFAAGFALWGAGGACASGALEALVYDGLAAEGAEDEYPRIYGRITAAGLLAQLPVAVAATVLFSSGGYALVGWASVACCLAAAALACAIPEHRPAVDSDHTSGEDGRRRYLTVLQAGLAEAAHRPAVRTALLAVAVLCGLDGLEEYFPLLAAGWGVTTSALPLAMLGIPLAAAAGAAAGGRVAGSRTGTLAGLLAAGVGVFVVAGLLGRPAGVAGIAVAYGLYHVVLVAADARLQREIDGPSRATVTSVASLGTELSGLFFFGVWALGHPLLVAAVALAIAAGLPKLLGGRAVAVETR